MTPKSSARMELYCDTESGFRVMFLPHRDHSLKVSRITLTIDDSRPVILDGDDFGDDDTDVVTIRGQWKDRACLMCASCHGALSGRRRQDRR